MSIKETSENLCVFVTARGQTRTHEIIAAPQLIIGEHGEGLNRSIRVSTNLVMSGIENQETTLSGSESGGGSGGLQTASAVQNNPRSREFAAEAVTQGGSKPGAAVDLHDNFGTDAGSGQAFAFHR